MTKKQYYDQRMKQEVKRKKLTAAALEKWSIKEIMTSIEEEAGRVDQLDLKEWAIEFLQFDGCLVIKPQSIAEEARLNEMVETLYPYANERQMVLLS